MVNKPCPFCGSEDLKEGGDDKVVGVWCNRCGATGPNGYQTAETWNSRALSQAGAVRSGADMIKRHRFALHEDGNCAEIDSNGLAEEIDTALAALAPSPSGGGGVVEAVEVEYGWWEVRINGHEISKWPNEGSARPAAARIRAALSAPPAPSAGEPTFSSDDVEFLNNEWWVAGYEKGKADALATPPATPVQPTASVEGVAKAVRDALIRGVEATVSNRGAECEFRGPQDGETGEIRCDLGDSCACIHIGDFADRVVKNMRTLDIPKVLALASLTPAPTQGDGYGTCPACSGAGESPDGYGCRVCGGGGRVLAKTTPSPAPVSAPATAGEVRPWPKLKKALWDVVTSAQLNAKYVNAWDLTERLYQAALSNPAPGHDS